MGSALKAMTTEDRKQLEAAIEIAKKQILDKLAFDDPWIWEEPHGVYHQVKSLKDGVLQFSVRVMDGFVTDLVIHSSEKRIPFKRKSVDKPS